MDYAKELSARRVGDKWIWKYDMEDGIMIMTHEPDEHTEEQEEGDM